MAAATVERMAKAVAMVVALVAAMAAAMAVAKAAATEEEPAEAMAVATVEARAPEGMVEAGMAPVVTAAVAREAAATAVEAREGVDGGGGEEAAARARAAEEGGGGEGMGGIGGGGDGGGGEGGGGDGGGGDGEAATEEVVTAAAAATVAAMGAATAGADGGEGGGGLGGGEEEAKEANGGGNGGGGEGGGDGGGEGGGGDGGGGDGGGNDGGERARVGASPRSCPWRTWSHIIARVVVEQARLVSRLASSTSSMGLVRGLSACAVTHGRRRSEESAIARRRGRSIGYSAIPCRPMKAKTCGGFLQSCRALGHEMAAAASANLQTPVTAMAVAAPAGDSEAMSTAGAGRLCATSVGGWAASSIHASRTTRVGVACPHQGHVPLIFIACTRNRDWSI